MIVISCTKKILPQKLAYTCGHTHISRETCPENAAFSRLPPVLSRSFNNKLLTASISGHLLLTDFSEADVVEQSLCAPGAAVLSPQPLFGSSLDFTAS